MILIYENIASSTVYATLGDPSIRFTSESKMSTSVSGNFQTSKNASPRFLFEAPPYKSTFV